jgi:hypothetical protein
MKRLSIAGILLVLFTLRAYPQKKESQRVANAGRVITEVLGVPDNIPQDLLDKAECAIVLPGVLKFDRSGRIWRRRGVPESARISVRAFSPGVAPR